MDGRQFEAMVRAYSVDLYRFAFWLCRNHWQAQDLVQDCFASAWRAREGLRDEGAIKAWLFSMQSLRRLANDIAGDVPLRRTG